jgi:phage terminase small subunit
MRQALLAVGYSDSYASHNSSKFLNNREVQKYIRERQDAEATAALADAICVKENLLKIIKDPQATPKEKTEAIKALDSHLEWTKTLESRLKELEVAKETPSVNTNPIVIKIEPVDKP